MTSMQWCPQCKAAFDMPDHAAELTHAVERHASIETGTASGRPKEAPATPEYRVFGVSATATGLLLQPSTDHVEAELALKAGRASGRWHTVYIEVRLITPWQRAD